jgi:transcriptional regulator with XRE-family HTH domain
MDLVPQVILLRAEGKTLRDIASLMNLSKQRISQVIQVAKRHEAIQARWGFPFSVRTDRILEDLAVRSKEDALELRVVGGAAPQEASR